jgi:hypothetical protein
MSARTGFRLMPWAKWRVGFDGDVVMGSDEVKGPYFRRIVPGEEDMFWRIEPIHDYVEVICTTDPVGIFASNNDSPPTSF